jgi:hypothetical protein
MPGSLSSTEGTLQTRANGSALLAKLGIESHLTPPYPVDTPGSALAPGYAGWVGGHNPILHM